MILSPPRTASSSRLNASSSVSAVTIRLQLDSYPTPALVRRRGNEEPHGRGCPIGRGPSPRGSSGVCSYSRELSTRPIDRPIGLSGSSGARTQRSVRSYARLSAFDERAFVTPTQVSFRKSLVSVESARNLNLRNTFPPPRPRFLWVIAPRKHPCGHLPPAGPRA